MSFQVRYLASSFANEKKNEQTGSPSLQDRGDVLELEAFEIVFVGFTNLRVSIDRLLSAVVPRQSKISTDGGRGQVGY